MKNIQIKHGTGKYFLIIQISPWNSLKNISDKPWDWYGLSKNPTITMEFVEKYLDKPWNWYVLFENLNITLEFIENYLDKPCYWKELSKNPNITIEYY